MERMYFYRFREKGNSDALWEYAWNWERNPEDDPASDFEAYLEDTEYDSEIHEAEYLGMIAYGEKIETFFDIVNDNDFSQEVTFPFWDEFALFLGRAKGDPNAFQKTRYTDTIVDLEIYCYRYQDKAGADLEDFQTTNGKWIYEWCHTWDSEERYNEFGFPEYNLSVEQGRYLGNYDEFHPDVREVEYLGVICLPEKLLDFFVLGDVMGGKPDAYFLDPIMGQAFVAFAKANGDRSPMEFDSRVSGFVPLKPLSDLYDR